MYSLDWGYHLYVYTECVTERMLSRVSYVCKNEIEDESHVIFRCSAYERFRKEVNIIASTSTTQDTFNALSRVMAADDEESVIQLSRFLYRVFDMRNRAVSSE